VPLVVRRFFLVSAACAAPAVAFAVAACVSGGTVALNVAPDADAAGTKPGCTVQFRYGNLTGRVPLENGFVSLTPAYLTP
jgi:hypothetical protein